MFEFAPDAEQSDPSVKKLRERYFRLPNHVGMVGLIEDPYDKRLHGPSLVTGVDAQIVTGRDTKFRVFVANVDGASGMVVTMDEKPVTGGTVIVILKAKNGARETYQMAKVQQGGTFHVPLESRWDTVQAYYVPLAGYGDCYSKILTRKAMQRV